MPSFCPFREVFMSGPIRAKFFWLKKATQTWRANHNRSQPCAAKSHAIVIVLETLAGNECHMPANLAHYEDLSQLEEDIVSFLPTVSDLEVFGCELDLVVSDTQLPLQDPMHSMLKEHSRLQVVVRPCMEDGHSVWQFQDGDREGYPKILGSCCSGVCCASSALALAQLAPC